MKNCGKCISLIKLAVFGNNFYNIWGREKVEWRIITEQNLIIITFLRVDFLKQKYNFQCLRKPSILKKSEKIT